MGTALNLVGWRDRARSIAAMIDAIRREAAALGRVEDERLLLREANRLHDHVFQIVVVGEFSRGKSSVLNALVGLKLLPAKLRPTTAALTHLRAGPSVEVTVERVDGTTEEIAPEKIADVVTGEGAALVRRVCVSVPCPWLREGVELIDTPGVNDLNEAREEVTLQFLPNADAALFVLDAQQCLTDSERAFLARAVVGEHGRRVFFALNKVDQLDDRVRDVAALTERIRSSTRGIVDNPRVFPVSAKLGLAARLGGDVEGDEASGVPALEAALAEFLASECAAGLVERVAAVAQGVAARLEEGVGVRLAALGAERGAAVATLRGVEEAAGRDAAALAEVRRAWQVAADATGSQVCADVERRIDEARGRAEARLAASGADPNTVVAELRRDVARIAEVGQGRLRRELTARAAGMTGEVSTALIHSSDVPELATARTPTLLTAVAEVTPSSAIVAAGAMGVATLLSMAAGPVLLVGALAYFAARTAEAQIQVAERREILRAAVSEGRERLTQALQDQARSLRDALWSDVGGAAEARATEARRSVDEAKQDLEQSQSFREAQANDLDATAARLRAARSELASGTLDALAGLRGTA